jgi:hypothetical protein
MEGTFVIVERAASTSHGSRKSGRKRMTTNLSRRVRKRIHIAYYANSFYMNKIELQTMALSQGAKNELPGDSVCS